MEAQLGRIFRRSVSGIYSGTADAQPVARARKGRQGRVHRLRRASEDYFKLERGIQTYLSVSPLLRSGLHVATHFHNEPLVPRELMRGRAASGSTCFGDVAIPPV